MGFVFGGVLTSDVVRSSSRFLSGLICILLTLGGVEVAAQKKLVQGGQFKDLILPMPIIGSLTKTGIWGTDKVLPRDVQNGLESPKWCYWGGNPMLGKDGKYHLNIARWPEAKAHWGWPKSEVAHAISDHPLGPYTVTGTALPEAHNPEVVPLNDGTYMLHVSKGNIYTSPKLEGPWQLQGRIEIDTRGFKGLSHLYTNLTGLQRADDSFLFFTKRGDVMISKSGFLGPYEMVSSRNYDRYSGYPEDPVIWKSRHQYHVIFNHAVDKKSVYMRSLDGIKWNIEPGIPYDKSIFRYTDGTTNEWVKFERPKVLQDEFGRATHLSLAVIDVEKKEDLGNDNHSSKHVILPLLMERLVEIVNTEKITPETKEITIRIKAEKGFNPFEDIEMKSLRLGVSDMVNYGAGAKANRSKNSGEDLLVTFDWNSSAISPSNYDLKVLGKNKNGGIIYGYALLPQFSEDPASLATLPIKIKNDTLYTEVENFGLQASKPSKLKVFQISNQSRKVLKDYTIPALKPYEKFDISFPVKLTREASYEARIVDAAQKNKFWNKVDDSDTSVNYQGDWRESTERNDLYFGTEKITPSKGASVTYSFSGTQARCYGSIGKERGSFDVYIDDVFIERIDCFFGANLYNTVIYQTGILPSGIHKLELQATGQHYKGNPKGYVAVDGFSFID
ncbi:MAG: glycoside hydrolase family protein [Bacteroidota bacterium]